MRILKENEGKTMEGKGREKEKMQKKEKGKYNKIAEEQVVEGTHGNLWN